MPSRSTSTVYHQAGIIREPQILSSPHSQRNGPSRATYSRGYVSSLFNQIAHRYDLVNHILSSGIDILWRRRTIDLLLKYQPREILDVATGTGDLAFEAARLRPVRIVGIDIAGEMLKLARDKAIRKGLESLASFQEGPAEKLPFPTASFDAVTVGFGVRNFEDLERGLAEIYRVLRAGGPLVILEFSRPHSFLMKQIYSFYSFRILPSIGALISGNRDAYKYLPSTIREFPDGDEFLAILGSAGFTGLTVSQLTFGVASIYHGHKPNN